MSFIAYQTNKKTGTVYAYRQESYRDPETKKTKVRRTYIGRVDPVTKAIIGKAEEGKRNRSPLVEETPQRIMIPDEVNTLIEGLRKEIQSLTNQVLELKQKEEKREETINKMIAVLSSARS